MTDPVVPPDAVTIFLLGGPRHGTTVRIPRDHATVSFPSFDPPTARIVDLLDPQTAASTSVTRHDYDVVKLVDLDGAIVLLGLCRDDPRPIRSILTGAPLSIVDHRDRHPSYTAPRTWRP